MEIRDVLPEGLLRRLGHPSARSLSAAIGITLGRRFRDGLTYRDLLAIAQLVDEKQRRALLETYGGMLSRQRLEALVWIGRRYSVEEIAQERPPDERAATYALARRLGDSAPNRTTVHKRNGLGMSEPAFVDYVAEVARVIGDGPAPEPEALLGLCPPALRTLLVTILTPADLGPRRPHRALAPFTESPAFSPGVPDEHRPEPEVPVAVEPIEVPRMDDLPELTSALPTPARLRPEPVTSDREMEIPIAGVCIIRFRSSDTLTVVVLAKPPSCERVRCDVSLQRRPHRVWSGNADGVRAELQPDASRNSTFRLVFDRGDGEQSVEISAASPLRCTAVERQTV